MLEKHFPLSIMHHYKIPVREIGMLPHSKNPAKKTEAMVAQSSTWVRASQSGILRTMKTLGAKVLKDELMAVISDPFGEREEEIRSAVSGIIIGRTNIPLVNEGEALFHIARFRTANEVDQVEEAQNLLNPDNYELKQQELAGKQHKMNSTKARQRADELQARLKRRLEELDQESAREGAPLSR